MEIKKLHFETIHQRKDGTTYPVEVHLQLLNTKLSNEFLAVIIDISEQQKMNQQIQNQEEIMLVQSRHAAMGEMISMIAHQWRQPISIVGMLSNTIMLGIQLNKVNMNSIEEDLKNINQQVQYMSKTIDDFRNFFQKSKTIEKVNIYDLLMESRNILSAILQRHNIDFAINCEATLNISTYSRELVQVIINIISNAKDALKEKSGKRMIIIDVIEHEKDIEISIFNNGNPIKESLKNKIFEPYFTTKEDSGGTGLGLYMVKSILHKHMQGKIEVQNEHYGVEFTITLPRELKTT